MAIDSPTDEDCVRSSDDYGVDPYYEDIYNYLRSQEKRSRPAQNYMSRQTDVTTSMRNILVDWLVEVCLLIVTNVCTIIVCIILLVRFPWSEDLEVAQVGNLHKI